MTAANDGEERQSGGETDMTAVAPKGGKAASGVVKRERVWISEKVIRRLAKVARLEYVDGSPIGGGGLCRGLGEGENRTRALCVLGLLVDSLGDGSTDKALLSAGASWLDIEGWLEEDEENGKLWAAVERVRLRAATAQAFDKLMDRACNGYDAQEARTTREGVEVVTVRKYDNGMAVQLLKSLGYVGGKEPAGPKAGGKKAAAKAAVPAVGEPQQSAGTVLFADRKTAFEAMGAAGSEESEVAADDRKER